MRPSHRLLWASGAVVVAGAVAGGAYLLPSGSEQPTDTGAVVVPYASGSPESSSASLPVPTRSPSSHPSATVTQTPTHTVTAPSKTKTATRPPVTVTKPAPTHTVTKTPAPTTVTPKPNPTYGSGMSQYEVDVLTLVWKERAKVCSGQIVSDPTLNEYARNWSAHMSANRSMVHSTLSFSGRTKGENIAYGQRSAAEVMSAWMNSPGHRANILNCGYTKIGIGYAASGNYWTQDFAS